VLKAPISALETKMSYNAFNVFFEINLRRYPMISLAAECVESQVKAVGGGGTWALSLAALLAGGADRLHESGCGQQVILDVGPYCWCVPGLTWYRHSLTTHSHVVAVCRTPGESRCG